jgi:hypothetical protein
VTGKEVTVVEKRNSVGIAMEAKMFAQDLVMISSLPKPGSLEAFGPEQKNRVRPVAGKWISWVAQPLVLKVRHQWLH